jgi:hypothetical protein
MIALYLVSGSLAALLMYYIALVVWAVMRRR